MGGIPSGIKAIGGAFAGLGAALGIGKIVTAASDLNEQISKSRQVFGQSSSAVETAAQEMADAFGIPKREFIDSASSIGLIAKGAGQTQAEAANLGVQFARLGADASSFFNVPLEEALGAIRSGLVGESEPLRRFGVLLNEDAVKAEAARLGIAAMGTELSEGQKVMARSSLITKGLTDASGDLERTSGGVANRIRGLGGNLENIAADVGMAIQPITNVFLGLADTAVGTVAPMVVAAGSYISEAFIGVLNTVQPGLEAIGQRLLEFPANFTAAFGADTAGMLVTFGRDYLGFLVQEIEAVGWAFRNLPDLFDVAVLYITQGVINITEYFATIPTNLGIIADYIANNWTQLISDAINAVGLLFQNLGKNIGEFANAIYQYLRNPLEGFQFDFTPLLENFQATAAELPALVGPELTSLQDQIDAKLATIAENETARTEEIAAANAAITPPEVATPTAAVPAAAAEDAVTGKGKKDPKVIAEALTLGSKEARSADLAFRMGTGGGLEKINADQLGVQKQTLAEIKKLNGKSNGNGDLQVVEFA